MPIEIGRRHGNSYHGNVTQKVTIKMYQKECIHAIQMEMRINNKKILEICPKSCDCFDRCLKKSLELEEMK